MRVRPALLLACLLAVAGCSGQAGTVTGTATDAPTDTVATAEPDAPVEPEVPADGSATADDGAGQPGAEQGGAGQNGAPGGAAGGTAPGGTPAPPGGNAGGAAAPPGSSTYTDSRYGFSATIPAGFTQAGAVQDRGMKFTGPNGVALEVYGSANLLQDVPEQACQELAEALRGDGGTADVTMNGSTCVVTAQVGGTSHKIQTWVGSVTMNHVDVAYPASAAAQGEQAFQQAVAGFKPGDLEASH